MLTPLKDFFHYSRGERRGVFVLILILFLLLSWYFVRSYFNVSTHSDFSEFKKEIAEFDNRSIEVSDTIEYFVFNPNEIGVDEWMLLGFSEKQATSIENYKSSGAVFKIKTDVKKLFMVDEQKYLTLEPYIDLPISYDEPSYDYDFNYSDGNNDPKKESYVVVLKKSPTAIYNGFEDVDSLYYTKRTQEYWYCVLPFETEEKAKGYIQKSIYKDAEIEVVKSLKGFYLIDPKPVSESKQIILVNINDADSLAFSAIPGIGFGYAKRIIKYRNILGGFVSIEQMKEVYKLPPEVIDDNIQYFKLGDAQLSKININIVDVATLKKHPYISWNIANSIVQMRNAHGNFKQVEDIKKSDLINEELFLKIAPYLTTE